MNNWIKKTFDNKEKKKAEKALQQAISKDVSLGKKPVFLKKGIGEFTKKNKQ